MGEANSDELYSALDEASNWFLQSLDENEHKYSVECHLGLADDESVSSVVAAFSAQNDKGELIVKINLNEVKKIVVNKTKAHRSSLHEITLSKKTTPFPILTSAVASTLSDREQLLFLVFMPLNYMLWNTRRQLAFRYVNETPRNESINFLIRELIFMNLLLSLYHKMESIWGYRLYIMEKILSSKFFDEKRLLIMYKSEVEVISLSAHFHFMNYAAWSYRRYVCRLFMKCSLLAEHVFPQEIQSTTKYITEHNGDHSACSYLIFLLENVSKCDTQCTASELWRKLMYFTQTEIRRHCSIGHECIWELRWNLINFALDLNVNSDTLLSSWTIKNELELVSAYIDGYGRMPLLLSPKAVERSWCEVSGDLCWTSYLACRYGLQLLKLCSHSSN